MLINSSEPERDQDVQDCANQALRSPRPLADLPRGAGGRDFVQDSCFQGEAQRSEGPDGRAQLQDSLPHLLRARRHRLADRLRPGSPIANHSHHSVPLQAEEIRQRRVCLSESGSRLFRCKPRVGDALTLDFAHRRWGRGGCCASA